MALAETTLDTPSAIREGTPLAALREREAAELAELDFACAVAAMHGLRRRLSGMDGHARDPRLVMRPVLHEEFATPCTWASLHLYVKAAGDAYGLLGDLAQELGESGLDVMAHRLSSGHEVLAKWSVVVSVRRGS